ncbi:MAG: hypothetical protein KF678_11505 [Phycisphaeraceae bacterium]|nr:hypothetical protein [Phycisphaeraceae bacterium]
MKTACAAVLACAACAHADYTNNILITGYWPPTNEMIRRFSTSATQNPGGWIGGNWEGLGYNIHSYFPEFPGGVGTNPQGTGDFMVDYQDTSEDWWRITAEIRPVAIITFSRGSSGSNWELEARTKNRASWINDYIAPFQPTPSPPDPTVPAETIRFSTLPMQNIVNAVNQASLGISAFIDSNSANLAGGFLSEFIGYHGSWYQSIHSDPSDPSWCVAAGHLHVGIDTPLAAARTATDVTLRELIAHVNSIVPTPSAAGVFGLGLAVAARRRRPLPCS